MVTNRTISGDFLFKVNEYGNGIEDTWISLEPRRAPEEFKKVLIGFNLPKGTNFSRAQEIAKYLNENLEGISLTFSDGAMIR